MENAVTIGKEVSLRAWPDVLRRFLSGPLLGWASFAVVLLLLAVYGFFDMGDLGWFILVPGPAAAAVALNACTLLASFACGQTRQLRASWLAFVALLGGLAAAATIWPAWGRDMGIVIGLASFSLCFPADLIVWFYARQPLPRLPWGLDRADAVILPLAVLALGYLQAFVLLPLLFKWRNTTAP